MRNNPKDDETRYNLALAQKLLKDQQQNQQNQDNKDNQDKQDQDKKDQDKKDQEKKEQERRSRMNRNKISSSNLLNRINRKIMKCLRKMLTTVECSNARRKADARKSKETATTSSE